jgi:hypothetical protein
VKKSHKKGEKANKEGKNGKETNNSRQFIIGRRERKE